MKKASSFLVFLFAVFVGFSTAAVPQLKDLLEGGCHSSALVHRLSEYGESWRAATQQSIRDSLARIQAHKQDPVELHRGVLASLENDIRLACLFHRIIKGKEHSEVSAGLQQGSFPLRFNKVHIICRRARLFLADDSNFTALMNGTVPDGFAYEEDLPPILGPDTAWGSSRATTLIAALFTIERELGQQLSPEDVEASPILHSVPFPEGFRDKLFERVPEFRDWRYITHNGPGGLVTPHNGYAFGGHRPPYPLTTPRTTQMFAPEDCASIMAKVTGFTTLPEGYYEFATVDLLYAERVSRKLASSSPLAPDEQEWFKGKNAQNLVAYFKPRNARDMADVTEIRPGMVYTIFPFSSTERLYNQRRGGHTGLVVGRTDSGDLITYDWNRNIPRLDEEIRDTDGFSSLFAQEGVGGYDADGGQDMAGFGLAIVPQAKYWDAVRGDGASTEVIFFEVPEPLEFTL